MRRCIKTFPASAVLAANTQTITGVADSAGSFRGEIFIWQSGFAVNNTLTAGAVYIGGYSDFRGIDQLTLRSAVATTDAYSPFNFKATDGMVSFGDHSLLDSWSDNFGQSQLYRAAKVSASRVGEFDLTYSYNQRTGDDIQVIILAEIDITFTNYINGTYTTPSKPQGLINYQIPAPAASGSTTWGTGTGGDPFGFATRRGDYGVTELFVVNQGNNFSCCHTDGWAVGIDGATGVQSAVRATISAWNPLSFTIANGGIPGQTVVFSGENVRCTGGSITQGTTSFNTEIFAELIWFISIGQVANAAVTSPASQHCRGWADGTSQASFWTAEKTNGNTAPLYGARYQSNDSIIRLASNINGLSTTFGGIANVVGIARNGTVTLNWSVDDLVDRQVLWFAIGQEAQPDEINRGKGIYKLVPDKRQDTIWYDVLTESTYLAKKPDPAAHSFYAGDE